MTLGEYLRLLDEELIDAEVELRSGRMTGREYIKARMRIQDLEREARTWNPLADKNHK